MRLFKCVAGMVFAVVVILALGAGGTAQAPIDFKHYHTNAELVQIIQSLAKDYPRLVSVEEAGKSVEGKPVWAVTITNRATGAPENKPAMYMDGNTHAGEVSGAEASLHMIHTLATQFGKDPMVTEALDKFTYYVLPRVNPDGAERYLSNRSPDNPRVRDINGDGMISTMRVRDPNGPLRTNPEDPRLMVPRKGGEAGEWRIIGQEGDGPPKPGEPPVVPFATVSNRNYPAGWWSSDEIRHGQGKYPLSEPESKTQVDFVLAHPNVNSVTAYHTHSGLILRPYGHKADDAPMYRDLPYFDGIGHRGTEITGYGFVSTFAGFTPDPTQSRLGTFKDWAYIAQALVAWTIEIWKAPGEEGSSAFEGMNELKLMQYVDQKLAGRGFLPWQKYNHPVYGEVELGGLDQRWVVQNVPPEFLEAELQKLTRFAIVQGMMSPLVRITNTAVEDLGGGVFRVRASVQNQGYLPTYLPRAVALGIVRGVRLTVEGADILSEPPAQDLGIMEGWGPSPENGAGAPVKTASWIVRGKPGAELTVRVTSTRGGRDEKKVALPAAAAPKK